MGIGKFAKCWNYPFNSCPTQSTYYSWMLWCIKIPWRMSALCLFTPRCASPLYGVRGPWRHHRYLITTNHMKPHCGFYPQQLGLINEGENPSCFNKPLLIHTLLVDENHKTWQQLNNSVLLSYATPPGFGPHMKKWIWQSPLPTFWARTWLSLPHVLQLHWKGFITYEDITKKSDSIAVTPSVPLMILFHYYKGLSCFSAPYSSIFIRHSHKSPDVPPSTCHLSEDVVKSSELHFMNTALLFWGINKELLC